MMLFDLNNRFDCLIKYLNHSFFFKYVVATMARGRKGKKKKDDNNNDDDYRSVKLALGTVILEPYRLPLITFISEMSIKATCIASLASLAFLYKVRTYNLNSIFFIVCVQIKQSDYLINIFDFFFHFYPRPIRQSTMKTTHFSQKMVRNSSSLAFVQC